MFADPRTEPPPLNAEQRVERDAAIQQFVERFTPGPNADLYAGMLTTLCRLARENCGRGELKILEASLKELRYAFKVFAPYSHCRKVSIFGSARTPEGHPEYEQALRFAEAMRQADWMVITGAGDGIMKAGHGGAGAEGSFGVAIRLPFEQMTNEIIADDPKLVTFKYFFTRKLMFMKEASGVALFPGGFGTQDEGFEALTLVQTGKATPVPIVMIDAPRGRYWQHWRNYVSTELLGAGMISPEDLGLFFVTDDYEAARRHILKFYRVYHSSRFVRDQLVIRLNFALAQPDIDRLNSEFRDLLTSGAIVASAPLPEEGDDVRDKPRLVLRFNRRSHGRLRQLIDRLNDCQPASGSPAGPPI